MPKDISALLFAKIYKPLNSAFSPITHVPLYPILIAGSQIIRHSLIQGYVTQHVRQSRPIRRWNYTVIMQNHILGIVTVAEKKYEGKFLDISVLLAREGDLLKLLMTPHKGASHHFVLPYRQRRGKQKHKQFRSNIAPEACGTCLCL